MAWVGIIHRLTQPRHPTTGKIEQFHGSLRRELLSDAVPFADLAAAQSVIDSWVTEYNTTRPHQAIGMAAPAERFSTAAARAEDQTEGQGVSGRVVSGRFLLGRVVVGCVIGGRGHEGDAAGCGVWLAQGKAGLSPESR